MDEYIKRSDLIGNFPYNISFCDEGDIYNWINTIPSADVRENVRGEWIFEKGDGMTCVDGWCCSNCKHGFHTNVPYFSDFNFCPFCGARMRGETNG